EVPGLDTRREDIPLLLEAFVASAARRHRLTAPKITPAAVTAAMAAEWPGHLRELKHAAEQAGTEASAEPSAIEPRHPLRALRGTAPPASPEGPDGPAVNGTGVSYNDAMRAFQGQLITAALNETDWNVAEAARRLGITRSHVYNLIREFGLRRGQA